MTVDELWEGYVRSCWRTLIRKSHHKWVRAGEKNAEAKHVEIWHEFPAMADSHFFFLRNNDITKKKKAKQNSQNKQK